MRPAMRVPRTMPLGYLSRLQQCHDLLLLSLASPPVFSVARLIVTAMLRKRYQQEAKLMKPQLVLEPLKVGDKYVARIPWHARRT